MRTRTAGLGGFLQDYIEDKGSTKLCQTRRPFIGYAQVNPSVHTRLPLHLPHRVIRAIHQAMLENRHQPAFQSVPCLNSTVGTQHTTCAVVIDLTH